MKKFFITFFLFFSLPASATYFGKIPKSYTVYFVPDGASCNVSREGGSASNWIDGTPANSATGRCVGSFVAGTFPTGVTPVCQLTPANISLFSCTEVSLDDTSFSFRCFDGGGAAQTEFEVTCTTP